MTSPTLKYLLLSCLAAWGLQDALAQGYRPDERGNPNAEYEQDYGASSNAMRYYNQGLQCERAGDLHKAVEAYRRSVGNNPKIKQVHYQLARCLATLGQNDEAMGEFRQALNIDHNYVECRNDYGMYLWRKGNTSEATTEFKKCMQIAPKYPYPYFNLGLILKEKGDLEGAIENFEHTINLKPDFADAQRELGLAIFERAGSGDLNTAMETLQKAVQLAPNNPKVHYHLGYIYATKGNLDLAETELRKALMLDDRFAAAHWELARLRYFRGDIDRCQAETAEALKVNPTYTETKRYPAVSPVKAKELTARCLEFKGKLPEAVDAYIELGRMSDRDGFYARHVIELDKTIKKQQKELKKKPLSYDPEEVDAYVAKGLEQYEDGDLDGAKASFQRALEIHPGSFSAMINLSAVQEAQGDLNNAVASNQKACELNPLFDGAVYNLAYLLEKMNLPSDAGMMYQKFHGLAGKYPYDPRHAIELQQHIIRQQKIEENRKRRGY